MFRFIRILVLLIVIAVVVIGTYLWVARVPTLERFLSNKLNTKVVIEDVKIGFNRLSIKGLKIENSTQSTIPHAFTGGEITLEMNFFALFKKRIYIDKVKVVNPTIGIELYNTLGNDNNWARILNGLPSGGDKTFIIDQLIIENLQFNVISSNGKELSIPAIPYLEFADLGQDKALTLSQISKVIFQTILSSLAHKSNLGALLDQVSAIPQNLLEGVTSTLPLKETKDAIQESVDTIKKKTEEATEFLHDLFSNALQIIPSDHKILGS